MKSPRPRHGGDSSDMPAEADLALTAAFVAALPEPERPAAAPPAELEGAIAEALRAARQAWPDLDVPPEVFAAHLATRTSPPPLAAPAIGALRAADLYLACACLRGDARAIAAFEGRYYREIDRVLGRLGLAPTIADDLKGVVRERFFFPKDGERSPLTTYSGRGRLDAWVRAIAASTAHTVLRAARREAPEERALDVAVPNSDPELAYLKATFAAEFKAAFAEAVEALSIRERNLLRQHALDGLSIDQLGALYRVHRATAARWVVDVRARLLDGVRERLQARLQLSEAELKSVMALARSQIDVSVRRLLQPEDE
jgi:RNA polymerase sigma-70 factor (ECF subfamily)